MTEISACQIFNEVNQERITLYVEWHEAFFEIMLVNLNGNPLKGEMGEDDITYFSDELSKSRNEYLQETKNAFHRRNAEIQFFIKDGVFEWKRHNIWTLGRVTLCPIVDVEIVSKTLRQVLNSYEVINERLTALKAENDNLRNAKLRLSSDIEDMIRIKTSMENDLYKKFLLILNSKKNRIRELQKALEEKGKDCVFDALTDEDSSEETEIKGMIRLDMNKLKSCKRKSNEDDNKEVGKLTRAKVEADTAYEPERETSPQASTSKNFITNITGIKDDGALEDENTLNSNKCDSKPRKYNSRLSFVEDDSEDDLFSQ